jgi:hypothetical protein
MIGRTRAGIGADAMHTVERMRLTGGGKVLEDEIRIEDPKILRAPWTVTVHFRRQDDYRRDDASTEAGPIPKRIFMKALFRAVCAAAMALPAAAHAALAADHPDFSGLWATERRTAMPMPPMTQEGMRLFARNKKAIAESDPAINLVLSCMPSGFPRSAMGTQPLAIFQSPKALAMAGEPTTGVAHLIYIGGVHASGLPPQIEGDAVAHWEGDTLVADTVNIFDGNFIDGSGIPHSKALHVVQRFRLMDGGNRLEETLVIEDPVVFTKPWPMTFDMVRTNFRPPEKFCNEARNAP